MLFRQFNHTSGDYDSSFFAGAICLKIKRGNSTKQTSFIVLSRQTIKSDTIHYLLSSLNLCHKNPPLSHFFFFFFFFLVTMTMLMTESNFHSLDHNDNTKKKRRIVESTDTTTMIFNPVSQQFNKPNMVAPDFNCAAVVNNASIRIQLSNLLFKYKAVVLFFYEADL